MQSGSRGDSGNSIDFSSQSRFSKAEIRSDLPCGVTSLSSQVPEHDFSDKFLILNIARLGMRAIRQSNNISEYKPTKSD